MTSRPNTTETPAGVAETVSSLPAVAAVLAACPERSYLVGGAVRDLLLDRELEDLDFAIDGPVEDVARSLEGDVTEHPRFGTATIVLEGGRSIDLARTRSESYSRPGSLPEVQEAPIEIDLGRRDFTINAMAIPLSDPAVLIDPHSGQADLVSGTIRVLHPSSLEDDPTRALRAARYAARLGFEPSAETLEQIRAVDFSTLSRDRLDAEILLCAKEHCETGVLGKLSEWDLAEVRTDLADGICDLAAREDWSGYARENGIALEDLLVAAVAVSAGQPRSLEASGRLAESEPADGGEVFRLVEDHSPEEIVLARALGAVWLDRWCAELRHVSPDITGEDLIEAGVSAGPAIGTGLRAALLAKLEDPSLDRSHQLEIALDRCRGSDPPGAGE